MAESGSNDPLLEPSPYRPGATTYWNNSWRHIYEHFSQAILAYARRRGLNEHSAEDVLQEVMTTLIRCQHGQEARYDRHAGSFQAWLWGVIRNRVHSVRRKDDREKPLAPVRSFDGDQDTEGRMLEIPQAPADFAEMEENDWKQAILAAAISRMRQRVTPENFEIFAALLEETATTEELGRKFGKEANAIYAVKHRCEKMLLAEASLIREAWEQMAKPGRPT